MSTIEQKTAKAILEESVKVKVGRRLYNVKPVTLATLIRASEHISSVPKAEEGDNPIAFLMENGSKFENIAYALAVIIVGERKRKGIRRAAARIRIRRLAMKIADECTADDMSKILVAGLKQMDVSNFFLLTTFLQQANVTKRTKVD